MGLLYGRAGRLKALFSGFRPAQDMSAQLLALCGRNIRLNRPLVESWAPAAVAGGAVATPVRLRRLDWSE
jgi:hypothetical protein